MDAVREEEGRIGAGFGIVPGAHGDQRLIRGGCEGQVRSGGQNRNTIFTGRIDLDQRCRLGVIAQERVVGLAGK